MSNQTTLTIGLAVPGDDYKSAAILKQFIYSLPADFELIKDDEEKIEIKNGCSTIVIKTKYHWEDAIQRDKKKQSVLRNTISLISLNMNIPSRIIKNMHHRMERSVFARELAVYILFYKYRIDPKGIMALIGYKYQSSINSALGKFVADKLGKYRSLEGKRLFDATIARHKFAKGIMKSGK